MRRLVSLLAVLTLAATACGGGSGASDQTVAVDRDASADLSLALASASRETQEAGSARMHMSTEMPGMGSFTATGEFDFADQRGRMRMDMGSLFRAMGAPAGTDGTAEIVTLGMVMYMKMPGLLGDPRWVRIDLADAANQVAGVDVSQLAQMGSGADPAQSLKMLESVAEGTVTETGTETLNLGLHGDEVVTATGYRATVDLRRVYEDASAVTDRVAFEAFLAAMGDTELEVKVWIDEQGRLVRQTFEQPMPLPDGTTLAMRITMDLYDFGVDVDAAEPPASDVIDVSELAEALG